MKKKLGLVLFVFGICQNSFSGSDLLVSIAVNDVTPPIGVPLAGYGGGDRRASHWDFRNHYPYSFFMTPSKGILDPIRAKTVVLSKAGKMLIFVSLDTIAVTSDF